ncbi:hypothetical protein BGZ99_005245 [Dissophora globulifera]|uniref:Uncharacterized protein n=1 Tax=Dissophora globulifera TaxID=979702 RepID=A0A9P6RFM0_9FUNG|nr:hypothetical protein BGZ99_005245 [Dissophora globulifera]
MAAPLHIVFEKHLSSARPALPSPSFKPQSILIQGSVPSPSISLPSPDDTLSPSCLYGKRSSDSSSTTSTHSLAHDCYHCSQQDDGNTQGMSRSGSESSNAGDAPLWQRHVKWADRV